MQIELTEEEIGLINNALFFQMAITKDQVESGKWTEAMEYADMTDMLEDADKVAAFEKRLSALMAKLGFFKS